MSVNRIDIATLPALRLSNRAFAPLIVAVVLAGMALRCVTASQMAGFDLFQWQGRPLLSSNDGYYFLRLARDWLGGSLGARITGSSGADDRHPLAVAASIVNDRTHRLRRRIFLVEEGVQTRRCTGPARPHPAAGPG